MSHQSELIAEDIQAYLKQHENKELLRFLTCGSVDDGKSTLIGRLLHDSKMIYEDQLAEINADNTRVGNAGEHLDLALLVDGLQAEREQGITIDVAYRYFSTAKRKFIIADTPGHEQYTRNMATGASNCDLAIILIDARQGVQTQTRRHSFIISLLGIKHVLVAVNKMDLVDFSEARYQQIQSDYLAFAADLGIRHQAIQFVPISALHGDNVVHSSEAMSWYQGQPLMSTLETVNIDANVNLDALRFPVQYVNRPDQSFRGYSGTLTAGIVRPGDEVTVLPSGKTSQIKSVVSREGELSEAFPPMSVTLTLEDELDISRGDLIVHSHQVPTTGQQLDASLVWLTETPLVPGKEYEIKLATHSSLARVSRIHHQVDVNTLEQTSADSLGLNGIALCELTLTTPVVVDDYQQHPGTGSLILVDRLTNATVAAGMVHGARFSSEEDSLEWPTQSLVTPAEKAAQFGQKPALIVLTGACQETRTGLLYQLEQRLVAQGHAVGVVGSSNQVETSQEKVRWLLQQGLLVLTDDEDLLDQSNTIHIVLGNGATKGIDLNNSQLSAVAQLFRLLHSKGVL